jgi:hypothetical protein
MDSDSPFNPQPKPEQQVKPMQPDAYQAMLHRTLADKKGATHEEVLELAMSLTMMQEQRDNYGAFLAICLMRNGNSIMVTQKTFDTMPKYRIGIQPVRMPAPHTNGVECKVFFEKPKQTILQPGSPGYDAAKNIANRIQKI